MKIQINENDECFYKIGKEYFYAAKVFQDDNINAWYADSCFGDKAYDFFSSKPFKTKQEAIKHVDKTMKEIFKRILDE